MNDDLLDSLELPRAAVRVDATVADAAAALTEAGVGAVAVLDGDRVVGILTEDDLLRAVFPPYLDELTHTAFVDTDALLRPHVDQIATRRVGKLVSAAELVELPASALDVAQRFLHSHAPALVATRGGAFVGVIDQRRFCKAILGRYGWQF